MLKWQLNSLQSNINREVKNRTFGIRYFTIESAGLRVAYNSSISKSLGKAILNPPATFRGLMVFLCKVSETLCDDFSQFCKDQIISIVAKEKIPFILCLDRADDAVSETITLDQIKKATKALRVSLETTHWIIRTEALHGEWLFSLSFYLFY